MAVGTKSDSHLFFSQNVKDAYYCVLLHMNKNELRIGNLTSQGTVQSLLHDSIIISCQAYSYENVTPIPLTNFFLRTMGFTQSDCETDYMEWKHTNSEGICVLQISNDGGMDNHESHPYYFEKEGSVNGHYHLFKINIKYVHDLQNLYFILSGSDLTIKLQ